MNAKEFRREVIDCDDIYDLRDLISDYAYSVDDSHISGVLDEILMEYVDEDYVIDIIHNDIDDLTRLYYFLGDTDIYHGDLFRINAYGNLENADIEDLRDAVLSEIYLDEEDLDIEEEIEEDYE